MAKRDFRALSIQIIYIYRKLGIIYWAFLVVLKSTWKCSDGSLQPAAAGVNSRRPISSKKQRDALWTAEARSVLPSSTHLSRLCCPPLQKHPFLDVKTEALLQSCPTTVTHTDFGGPTAQTASSLALTLGEAPTSLYAAHPGLSVHQPDKLNSDNRSVLAELQVSAPFGRQLG